MKSFILPRGIPVIILTLLFFMPLETLQPQPIQADFEIFLPIIIKAPYQPEKGISLAQPNCEDIEKVGAGWYVNFSINPSAGCPSSDQRFVPMVYNAEQALGPTLATAINNAKPSGWLIGFGEPNLAWQGNTSPLAGAQAWRAIEAAALPVGLKLVSPVVSQHPPNFDFQNGYPPEPYGHTWIWKMVEEYQKLYDEKPHFDAIGWNYYGSNPQEIKNYLSARRQEALARGYNVPFWVTEYAGSCWNTDNPYPTGNQDIMTQVTPFLKSTPWITRFAWFTNRINDTHYERSCRLVNNAGNLTSLGSFYSGY